MAANVESMFYVRETPWHGLGIKCEEALTSKEALEKSGLDWTVKQSQLQTIEGMTVENYFANIRESDNQILGIVSNKYQIVQNVDAFAFTDMLIGEGVKYETAGSLAMGKRVWMLAKLPQAYYINGEQIEPYMVFTNSHDTSSAIRCALTPTRVVCQNTLTLALNTAKRIWSTPHTGNLDDKMREAKDTLFFADAYMKALVNEADTLQQVKINDMEVIKLINELIEMPDDATTSKAVNVNTLRRDLKLRYFDAPDLQGMDKNAYRYVNAVSDFATHVKPLRQSENYKESLFVKSIEGNPFIDKAYQQIKKLAIAV